MSYPAKTDPEVAALTFRRDLDRFWKAGAPTRRGWARRTVNSLQELITLVGDDGRQRLDYYLRVRADWYPDFPVQITLVEPDGISEPPERSTWLPEIQGQVPFGFGLHHVYDYTDPITHQVLERRQLICFSQSFDYYVSNHTPQPTERWQYPHHTIAATLNRMHEVLQAPYYVGPRSQRDSDSERLAA